MKNENRKINYLQFWDHTGKIAIIHFQQNNVLNNTVLPA